MRTIRFEKTQKNKEKVKKAKKRLWTIAKNLLKEIKKNLEKNLCLGLYQEKISIFDKIIEQTQPKTQYIKRKAVSKGWRKLIKILCLLLWIVSKLEIRLKKGYKGLLKTLISSKKGKVGKDLASFERQGCEKMKSWIKTIIANIESCGKTTSEEFITKISEFKKYVSSKDTKIYSPHEPHVYCITKGKENKKHEYGVKAAALIGKNSGVILGCAVYSDNPHDSRTIQAAVDSMKKLTGITPGDAYGDRGFKGGQDHLEEGVSLHLPSTPKKGDPEEKKEEAIKNFGRRSSIEPIFGHLKQDHRLSRIYLKGFIGDGINLILSAAAFNFKKWWNRLSSYKDELKKKSKLTV